MSGGVFANVKLNQKIANIKTIKSLIVHPGMSDCGISLGAALYVNAKKPKINQKNYYLGPHKSKDIDEMMLKYRIKAYKPKNISQIVATKLAEKKLLLGIQVLANMAQGHLEIDRFYFTQVIQKLTNF